jgi:hypothetical protein
MDKPTKEELEYVLVEQRLRAIKRENTLVPIVIIFGSLLIIGVLFLIAISPPPQYILCKYAGYNMSFGRTETIQAASFKQLFPEANCTIVKNG